MKRITEKFSWSFGATIVPVPQHTNITFYSSFKENRRQIVNLPQRKTKFTTEGKMTLISAPKEPPLPENCLQRIMLPFRKFKLYLWPNMIWWIVRPCNLEEFLTVRRCQYRCHRPIQNLVKHMNWEFWRKWLRV